MDAGFLVAMVGRKHSARDDKRDRNALRTVPENGDESDATRTTARKGPCQGVALGLASHEGDLRARRTDIGQDRLPYRFYNNRLFHKVDYATFLQIAIYSDLDAALALFGTCRATAVMLACEELWTALRDHICTETWIARCNKTVSCSDFVRDLQQPLTLEEARSCVHIVRNVRLKAQPVIYVQTKPICVDVIILKPPPLSWCIIIEETDFGFGPITWMRSDICPPKEKTTAIFIVHFVITAGSQVVPWIDSFSPH
mgnify:CR=1 FL=1